MLTHAPCTLIDVPSQSRLITGIAANAGPYYKSRKMTRITVAEDMIEGTSRFADRDLKTTAGLPMEATTRFANRGYTVINHFNNQHDQ